VGANKINVIKAVRKGLVIGSRGLRGFLFAALSGAVIQKPGRTGNFDCW